MRDVQACTIGLSINKNLKLEKGKEKSSSTARSYVQSSGYVMATCHYVTAICRNLTAVCQCRNSFISVYNLSIKKYLFITASLQSFIYCSLISYSHFTL